MAKLLEKNGAEMCAALVSIAGPIKAFMEDQEISETFKACTEKGYKNQLTSILAIYADMTPLLFGEKHLKNTLAILAAVEGKKVSELLKMNGVELLKDALEAWKDQIQPFFTLLGITA